MTTDIKLTPSSVAAFTEALKGESGLLDAWLEVNDESEVAAHIEAYASACVSSATAEKDAEIDALRTRLEDTVRDSTNKIDALRSEMERVNSWNARVSVCRDHVADIVDGLCVICSLEAAEARADDLRAEVGEWKDVAKCASEQQDSLFMEARALNERTNKLEDEVERVTCELMDAITRADKLAEALRRILDNEASDWKAAEEFGGYVLDDELREEALAALEQDKGSGYWPEMPKNGGPDWTGFDG